jgi:4-hydroxyphenylpyruvate dioxygenase
VADVDDAYHLALTRGATGVEEPRTLEDAGGALRRAAIAVYGDTIHTLIDRSGYRGVFAPLYEPLDGLVSGGPAVGLRAIDHVVANVEEGRMDEWADFYARVFGFTQLVSFDDKDISTEYSALRSKVMRNASGTVKLPINEPARGRRKSQIQEYLDYGGPGVQHIALATEGIIPTVSAMRERGVPFLEAPPSYYQKVPARIGRIAESLNDLQRLSILADRDEDGYLLQIFTLPVEDRPTLFYEIIQRAGSQSFGKGNFKELFEAIEREQARRGNLEEAVGAPL